MRRHFDLCNGAAESFVSCIALFCGLVLLAATPDSDSVRLDDPQAPGELLIR
jgi:hypothetical protein